MRNLKKILALVLALVMSFSLMATANAFTDSEKITGTYEEAVEVLNALKVFQGYEDGSFQPQGSITRAEVAAIIYRIVTGDVTDTQKGIYADYNKFNDVKSTSWYAGYVNFCANAEYIKGYDAKTFGPNDPVTGYQALAMILRAVGYDVNGEFTGSDWQVQTAAVGKKLGITDNVSEGTLGTAASREVVAEILFRAILVPQVEYTVAFGYQSIGQVSIGYETFKLIGSVPGSDKWGRPTKIWKLDSNNNKLPDTADTDLVTLDIDPIVTYTKAVNECQIAQDTGVNADKTYDLYVNGENNVSKYIVQALDTVQTLGGQGTLVEVYSDRIVVIDTFLAQVTDVKDATYDAAGHLRTPAMITLEVYTADTALLDGGTAMVLTNGATNYTYTKGTMVLVNSYTNNTVNNVSGVVTVQGVATTNKNVANIAGYMNLPVANYAVILGAAESIVGAQTFLWYNSLQHTVNGTNYDDAAWFKLDQAGTETIDHTWYFDQYGNLIGAANIATQYTYGIIENIQWQNPAMSVGYAQATIRYMDGTTETKVVTSIDGRTLTYVTTGIAPSFANGTISTSLAENAPQCGNDLFRIETAPTGTVSLVHVWADADRDGVKDTGEKSQINTATIGTGFAAIQGAADEVGGATVIYVNSNTTFLVRTGAVGSYTYTVVKGYENIANYTGVATVDWVNLDGDSYADYVFVTGVPDNATYYGMFYLTSNNAQAVLNAAGGIDYYVLTGIVDGVPGTIKLDSAATISTVPVAGMTEVQLEANLTRWVNCMFTAYHVDDEVTRMWGPKADIANLFNETHNNVAYTNLALDYQAASAVAGTITYDGQVLKVGNNYYNVVGLTPVVGTWTAPMDLSNMNVYVIYDFSKTIAGAYVAKSVYIASPAETGSGSGVAPSTNDSISLTNMGTNYTATMFKGTNTAINGSTTVVLQRRAVGGTEWQNAVVLNWTTGDGTTATPYTYTGTFSNGGVSVQYEMRVVAVNGDTVIATSDSILVYG